MELARKSENDADGEAEDRAPEGGAEFVEVLAEGHHRAFEQLVLLFAHGGTLGMGSRLVRGFRARSPLYGLNGAGVNFQLYLANGRSLRGRRETSPVAKLAMVRCWNDAKLVIPVGMDTIICG